MLKTGSIVGIALIVLSDIVIFGIGHNAVIVANDKLAAMSSKVGMLEGRLNAYENSPVKVSPEAIRAAMMADPTILVDVAQKLQDIRREEQAAASVDMTIAMKSALLKRTHGFIGNPKGSHVITEFFDYQCPHCRNSEAFLHQMAAKDPELLILRREIAALGQGSEIAARAAFAAARQGLYEQVSNAMLATPTPITVESALKAAKTAGADITKLSSDMVSQDITNELMDSQNLSVKVGVVGTPAFSAPGAGTVNGIGPQADFNAFILKASTYEKTNP